eukprot:TRINITY_DN11716_c0_g1_i2.p1 TRINITY_DN11716_c0_g1~~TRINITY_DN11716_c0_g1_i2.p1  ORF type:complete len:367 (-),score=94.26 TRINITY_DN11716_c0_g1_i2:34-1134(-)
MIPQTGPYPSFFHGSKYNDTKTFDDGVLLGLSLSLTHKVKEINIFHDNKFCYGLEVIYMDPATGKSTITSGKHKGNDAGWTTSTSNFKLDNDEYLTEVGGGSGAWMDRIYFCTSKNKKQSFGGPGGTPFSYIAPIGHHFGTFSVGIGGHLHNFELRAIPLPNAVLNLGALPPPQGQTNPGLNLGALPPPAQPNPGLNLGALPPPGQPNPGLNLGALPPPQPQPGPGLNLGGLPPPPGPAPIPPQGGAFDININFGNVGLNLNPLGGFNSNPVAPPPGGFISLPGPGAGAGNPFANRNPKKRATKSQAVGNGGGIYFDDLLEHLDGNFFDAALDQVTLYYDMRSAQGLETTYTVSYTHLTLPTIYSV